MSLSESILLMRQNLDQAEEHIKMLESGRKSSSSKSRASLMKIKGQSHELRKQIMEHTKQLPTKKRVTKEPVEPEPVEPVEVEEKPKKKRTPKK